MQKHSMVPNGLLTYQEASIELNRSLATIYRAVTMGVLHPVKLPHIVTKFLRQDEIEWFKDKELTPSNAKAYQGIIEQDSLQSFVEFFHMLIPVIYEWGIGHADIEAKNALRASLQEFIQDTDTTENEQAFLNKLAHTFTEKLAQKDLSFAERKIYRELLDAALTALSADLDKPATA